MLVHYKSYFFFLLNQNLKDSLYLFQFHDLPKIILN